MYGLYVNDKLRQVNDDLAVIKSMGFILAVKGCKVAYVKFEEV